MGLLAAFKNIQFSASVVAGGAASVLIYALGATLVAAGVIAPAITLPVIGITLSTITLFSTAAIPIGHLVTAIVPDSVNQQIAALAANLPKYQAMIPDVESGPSAYPDAPPATQTPSNIKNAAAALTVIQAHIGAGFPSDKNGV